MDPFQWWDILWRRVSWWSASHPWDHLPGGCRGRRGALRWRQVSMATTPRHLPPLPGPMNNLDPHIIDLTPTTGPQPSSHLSRVGIPHEAGPLLSRYSPVKSRKSSSSRNTGVFLFSPTQRFAPSCLLINSISELPTSQSLNHADRLADPTCQFLKGRSKHFRFYSSYCDEIPSLSILCGRMLVQWSSDLNHFLFQ